MSWYNITICLVGSLISSFITSTCLACVSHADKRSMEPLQLIYLHSEPKDHSVDITHSYKHMTDSVLVNLMICKNESPAAVEILRRSRHVVPSMLTKLTDLNLSDDKKILLLTYLGSTGDPRCVEVAGHFLLNGTPFVRAAAAAALGNVKSRRSAHYLLMAVGDESKAVRYVLPTEIAGLGHYVSRHYLRQKLLWGNSQERTGGAMCLGRLHDREAVNLLIKTLQDPNKGVQCASVIALGEINTAIARHAVVRTANSANGALRDAAVFCVNNFGRL